MKILYDHLGVLTPWLVAGIGWYMVPSAAWGVRLIAPTVSPTVGTSETFH